MAKKKNPPKLKCHRCRLITGKTADAALRVCATSAAGTKGMEYLCIDCYLRACATMTLEEEAGLAMYEVIVVA